MKRKIILFFAVILLQHTVAVAQTNALVKHLPDNALLVMNFDVIRLAGKIPAQSLQQNSIYQEMMKDATMPIGALLKEPAKSGIDFLPGIFLVMTGESGNEKPDAGVNIFIKLSNANLFTEKMKELFKDNSELIKTYGTDKIIQTEKGMTLGWNNDVFIMTSAYDDKIKEELRALYSVNDSATMIADTAAIAVDTFIYQKNNISAEEIEKQRVKIQERLIQSQRNICFNLLAPKSQNSLLLNEKFVSMLTMSADIKTWNSGISSPLGGNKLANLFGAGLGKLKGLMGEDKTSAINFENGKVVIVNNNYAGADVAAIYKKHPIPVLNTDLSRRLPPGKIIGMINISYNPQMGVELLQKTGMKEMLNDLKNPLPFNINLLYAALGSNMLVAVVKADDEANSDSVSKSMDGMQVVLAMTIANKAKFDELKSTISNMMDSIKNAKEEKFRKGPNPVMRYNDSLVVVSLSPAVAEAFLNSKGTATVPELLQSKTDYPLLMNINMKELFKIVLGKKMSGKEGTEEQRIMDMFDQFIVYGGKYENESMMTTMEFKFTNAADNSLKQLVDLINLLSSKKEGRVMPNNDDIKMEEIPIEEIKSENKEPLPPAKKISPKTKRKN